MAIFTGKIQAKVKKDDGSTTWVTAYDNVVYDSEGISNIQTWAKGGLAEFFKLTTRPMDASNNNLKVVIEQTMTDADAVTYTIGTDNLPGTQKLRYKMESPTDHSKMLTTELANVASPAEVELSDTTIESTNAYAELVDDYLNKARGYRTLTDSNYSATLRTALDQDIDLDFN